MATTFAGHVLSGTHAARPAATAVPAGTLYSCTTHSLVYQSDGATWSTWATVSGTETLPVSIIDAKGDLIAGTAADTAARLAVGTDGQILTADAASTPGVKWVSPAGGGAWTLLSTTTLSGSGTFDVSSISGAYNDLILVLIARGTDAGATESPYLRLNNDSAGNYYGIRNYGNAGVASSAGGSASAGCLVGRIPSAGGLANSFGTIQVTIFGYASTTWLKMLMYQSYELDALNANNSWGYSGGWTWNNTAACTRVQILGSNTANLATGSVLRIYGRL